MLSFVSKITKMVESEVEMLFRFRPTGIFARWSTSWTEIFGSILTSQFVAVILLFSRISLMWGTGEKNGRW